MCRKSVSNGDLMLIVNGLVISQTISLVEKSANCEIYTYPRILSGTLCILVGNKHNLWNLQPILKTAKAIYRCVDDVKLKDYTILKLRKQINAEGKKNVE
jgi:hypothetical protein